MDVTEEKVRELRRAMRDLVALATMPAAWVGRDARQLATGVADLLVSALRLEFAYVAVRNAATQQMVEASRVSGWPGFQEWARDVVERNRPIQKTNGIAARAELGGNMDGDVRVALTPIGLNAEAGVILTGCSRAEYPSEVDSLLLSVAANQAQVAFSQGRMLQELGAHEQELRDFVENASVPMHWVGPDGKILWANRAELELLGYSAADYIGRDICDFHVDREQCKDIMARLTAREALREREAQLRAKDGSVKHVLISSDVLWKNGRFVHTRCFTIDITERRKVEAVLRDSEERFRAVFQQTTAGIAQVDLAGRFVLVNDGFCRIVGRSRDELVKLTMQEITHPADVGPNLELFGKLVAPGGKNFIIEKRYVRPGGEHVWVKNQVSAIRDAAGNVTCITAVVTDVTEQKRAEQAVRESEERFQLAARATTDAIWDWKLASSELWWNEGVYTLFGYAPGQVSNDIGWWYEHIHAEDRDRVVKGIHAVIDGEGVFWRDEYRFLRADGSYSNIFDRGYVTRDAEGKGVRMIGAMQDLTERKRAEAALRESEQRFLQLAETIPQLAWMADPSGWIFWYNRRWYAYTGTTQQQMEGWGWQSVHDPNELPRVLDSWKATIATGKAFEMVFPLRGADGVFRQFLTRVEPLRDEHGQVVRWFGTNTDVSEQLAVQQALQKSEATLRQKSEQLAAALTASDTGTFRWDPNSGRFLDFDDNLKRLFGKSPDAQFEATEDFVRLVHPDDLPALAAALEASRNGADFSLEYRVLLEDGSVRWLYDRGKMHFEDGKPSYIVGACTDITRRKVAEEGLIKSEKLAAMGRLAGAIAHEINNPLEAVTKLVYLLRGNRNLDHEATYLLELLETELSRVSHITKQSLGFYRETAKPVPVSLAALVEEVIALFDRRLKAGSITVETVYRTRECMLTMPGEIRQVLMNLIGNAIEAMPAGGTLRVHVHRSSDRARTQRRGFRINVCDTGQGITHEVAKRMFDPFFTTKGEKGTGLGLWVTRGIVQKHEGNLVFRSVRAGRHCATCFSLFLPGDAVAESKPALMSA